MLKIQTEILINTAPDALWQQLIDFKSYPQWNPFITKVDVIDEQHLQVELDSDGSKMHFKPRILKNVPKKELHWLGKLAGLPGLFTGEHFFILRKTTEGTKLIHGENFSGILAFLLWPFIKKQTEANFIKMNEALKHRVEKITV